MNKEIHKLVILDGEKLKKKCYSIINSQFFTNQKQCHTEMKIEIYKILINW